MTTLTLHHGENKQDFTEHPTEVARRALMAAAEVEWRLIPCLPVIFVVRLDASGAAARRGDGVMARRRSITSQLYRPGRLSNDISAVASGNPRRVARRTRNVIVGHVLGRAGIWRKLCR